MPRSDDFNGFPRGHRRRPEPSQAPRERADTDRGRDDWRYPDPIERYGRDYEDQGVAPRQNSFADEWRPGPEADDTGFDTPRSRATPRPAWSEQDIPDDPFDWDTPEPPSEPDWQTEPDWRTEPYDRSGEANSGNAFGARNFWSERSDAYDTEDYTDTADRPAMRDDSLFRRIDGAVQTPDLSALTRSGRDDLHSEQFGDDLPRDPSELRDRFFTRTDPQDDDPAQDYAAHQEDRYDPQLDDAYQPDNVFPFEASRAGARQSALDDPYSWDSYDDDASFAPGEEPAPEDGAVYADEYGAYDPYYEDAHPHAEDALDADFLDDEPEQFDAPAEPPKQRRKLMVAGVLVAAVATGSAAAFVYKSFQQSSDGSGSDAPTVLAGNEPVKSEPSDPGGKTFPDGNKQIYDRLTGAPGDGAQASSASDDTGTAAIPGVVTTGTSAPADTLDERIAQALRKSGDTGDTTTAAPADPNSPRPVRTLTVRPDGSVVVPQGQPESASQTEPQTVNTSGVVTTTSPDTAETAARETSASEPEAQSASAAPAPERRPQPPEQPAQETRVASAEPATNASTQPSTASANPYFVQIAARRDQTSALAAFADLQQKYPNILEGLAPTIKRADLGDKGVWYRLWVGPMDARSNAQNVCSELKQAGLGGCFVRSE